jgi:hypothetical protein
MFIRNLLYYVVFVPRPVYFLAIWVRVYLGRTIKIWTGGQPLQANSTRGEGSASFE